MNKQYLVLVEDRSDDIDLTLRALKKNNIANDLVVLRDGAEALEYFFATGKYAGRNLDELPAVILLDIKLPKVDGMEVLKRLRANEQTKLIPVVILTSSKEERDVISGYQLGCNSYVRKPVTFEEFSEAVRNLGLYWLILNEPSPQSVLR
jgi:two-component system response regulator